MSDRFHKIRQLSVYRGGFLDGVQLDFSPHLNCIIGERGTGKTTVLEFLRWALCAMPGSEWAASQRKQIEKLVKTNLQRGRIRVVIETKDGMTYVVERGAAPDEPVILDEQHEPTNLSLEHGALFGIDVYSLNAIEHIAITAEAQLELIDRFVASELQPLAQRERAVLRDLDANAADLVRLAGEIAELDEELAELPNVEAQVAAPKIEGSDQADAAHTQLELKSARDREARYLEALSVQLTEDGRWAAQQEQRLERASRAVQMPDGAIEGPCGDAFTRIADVLGGHKADLEDLARQSQRRIESTIEELQELAEQVAGQHAEAEAAYRKALAELEQQREQATERERLMRRHNELAERQRQRNLRQQQLDASTADRNALVITLTEVREERTELRRQVATRLNDDLGPSIRVEIEEGVGYDAYRDLLASVLKRASRKAGKGVLATLVERLPPYTFVQLVNASDVQGIAQRAGIDPAKVEWAVELLRHTPEVYEIETTEVADVPKIQLETGGGYREASELSTGQKCTTILPILLLESDRPLLIDQPEDNLDNAFIYEVVVKQLHAVKQRRQMIFVTHNPNIPVLGDAECVHVLGSDGHTATVLDAGDVDAVRSHVERILEGGPEAFKKRMERYGR